MNSERATQLHTSATKDQDSAAKPLKQHGRSAQAGRMRLVATGNIQSSAQVPKHDLPTPSRQAHPDHVTGSSMGQLPNRIQSGSGAARRDRHPRLHLKPAKSAAEEKDSMLDIVNKVEMFRIVTEKINMQLQSQKKPPIFNLSAAPRPRTAATTAPAGKGRPGQGYSDLPQDGGTQPLQAVSTPK